MLSRKRANCFFFLVGMDVSHTKWKKLTGNRDEELRFNPVAVFSKPRRIGFKTSWRCVLLPGRQGRVGSREGTLLMED